MPGRLISEHASVELARRLEKGASVVAPPFIVSVRSSNAVLHRSMRALYGNYTLLDDSAVPDFVIRVGSTGGIRRLIRRQAMAFIDTPPPYTPLPAKMAPLMFEQAFNWCVATRTFTHLIMHAAVVARDGRAVIIPGESGQGKSTLCAALVGKGWRHISDEFALINTDTLEISAHPRPISLKNESIEAMRAWGRGIAPVEIMTGTPKGTIGYIPASAEAVEQAEETVMPAAVVMPGFRLGADPAVREVDKGRAFIFLTSCSVNYRELGEDGFNAMSELVSRVPIYWADYPDTASGVALVESLVLA